MAALAAVAPLVLPLDPECTSVEGYISPSASDAAAQPNSLWLRVTGIPRGAPTLAGARLEVGALLARMLAGHEALVATRFNESPSPAAFLVELRNVLAHLGSPAQDAGAFRPAARFAALKAELDAIGWDRVAHLEDDLSALALDLHDRRGRTHRLALVLPPGYPAAAPIATGPELPVAFSPRWGPGSGGLPDVVQQFEGELERHQALWDSLDDLDDNAWVLEPASRPPPRGVSYRRVALGNRVTLALYLDPLQPGAPPECRLMGPDRAVEPLAQRMHAGRALWRAGGTLRANLEAALGMQLPRRRAAGGGGEAAAEGANADCAICYAYRLPPPQRAGAAADPPRAARREAMAGGAGEHAEEGEAPDVNCDNAACGKPFHWRCLAEWLASDTATRQSFGRLFGACPYCSAPIAVRAG